jgi:hypothetical protein
MNFYQFKIIIKNVFLVPIIIFVFSAAEQQSCIKNDELRLINHWYSCRQLIDLIPHDIINIKQIDNQSNILRRWCGMHEPIIWRTSYVDEGSIKDKESSILCENQIANKLLFFFYFFLLWTGFRFHRQEWHTSYLLPGYSEISIYAWKSYKILTYDHY